MRDVCIIGPRREPWGASRAFCELFVLFVYKYVRAHFMGSRGGSVYVYGSYPCCPPPLPFPRAFMCVSTGADLRYDATAGSLKGEAVIIGKKGMVCEGEWKNR